MPRQSRIDAPGALHHIIVRGIERRKIFRDNADRCDFVKRLGRLVEETAAVCYAWALIPNHFHLLLRTGNVKIAAVMRRLLTGHATRFNRRHRGADIFSKTATNPFKSDERLLGDSDFVSRMLAQSQEAFERRYALKARGVTVDDIAHHAAGLAGIDSGEIWQPGRYQKLVTARSLLCFWAVQEIGVPQAALARRLGISSAAVSKSVRRGAAMAKEKNYKPTSS